MTWFTPSSLLTSKKRAHSPSTPFPPGGKQATKLRLRSVQLARPRACTLPAPHRSRSAPTPAQKPKPRLGESSGDRWAVRERKDGQQGGVLSQKDQRGGERGVLGTKTWKAPQILPGRRTEPSCLNSTGRGGPAPQKAAVLAQHALTTLCQSPPRAGWALGPRAAARGRARATAPYLRGQALLLVVLATQDPPQLLHGPAPGP